LYAIDFLAFDDCAQFCAHLPRFQPLRAEQRCSGERRKCTLYRVSLRVNVSLSDCDRAVPSDPRQREGIASSLRQSRQRRVS
jgi:hypothetical protein